MRVRVTLVAATLAAVVLVLGAAPALAASSSSASSPSAGSQTNASVVTLPVLVDVRTAHHPGFDRITFEFKGARPTANVRFVSQLSEDGSGKPVDLAGGAAIEVVFHGANAHDEQGNPTVSPPRFSPGLPMLKEVARTGDFEGVVSYGLGVDHRTSFTVLRLSGPSRVAVDILTGSTSTSGDGSAAGGGSAAGEGPAAGGSTSGGGSLPFTGSNTSGMLFTGLTMALVGGLVLALARKTRTP
jgi:uncharacterized membrane protein YgcG